MSTSTQRTGREREKGDKYNRRIDAQIKNNLLIRQVTNKRNRERFRSFSTPQSENPPAASGPDPVPTLTPASNPAPTTTRSLTTTGVACKPFLAKDQAGDNHHKRRDKKWLVTALSSA